MKTHILVLTALLFCLDAQAYSNFIANPYTPYPPGCATIPDLQTALYSDNAVKFFSGRIPLPSPWGLDPVDADVAAYRVACAEPNRSVILLEFRIPEDLNYSTYYETPEMRIVWADGSVDGVSLAREPNSWNVGIEPWNYGQNFGGPDDWSELDPHAVSWLFVLDSTAPLDFYFERAISPTQYNSSFKLELNWRDHAGWDIQVPSTASLFSSHPRIPLSGRLSGNWVVDEASDQGMVISISELVPAGVPTPGALMDSPLLMFLNWFTFDQNGNQLWLTGAAQFEIGATEVTIPIEVISKGEFLGSKTAERTTIGSVTIIGNSCNDLTFQYNLDMYGIGTGLGAGTRRLQRLFSLETAGYVCRDLEARILAK